MAISKYTIQDSSKNWTTNEFQNKLAYIKSGEDIRYNKITSNTSNSLTLQNPLFTVSIGSQYDILDPEILDVSKTNKNIILTGGSNNTFLMPRISTLKDGDVISIKNTSSYSAILYFEDSFDMLISPSYFKHSSLVLYPLEWINIVIEKSNVNPSGEYRILTKQFITQSYLVKPILNIGDNTNRIILDNYHYIYKTTITNSSINFSILNNNLSVYDSILSFELHINLTTINNITINGVTWVDGVTPVINEVKNYVLVFRSHDSGTTWIANLAYTY